ncbi:hypothetical protein BHM03_00024866 [Ensete ventricosum]|nr:hypothetical protein BHM03_00024866 [Ensete ventricosum]
MVSRKYVTVINFVQSRVSIDFSCTISESQNTGHSQCINMLENGFFICRLYSEEDLQWVLEGYWTICGRLMILRHWAPDVRLELDSLQSIPIWVSFHELSLHLWGRHFIAKLYSTLGQPLYIDKATASQTRLTFARACAMVSSDEEPPNEVFYLDLDESTRKVQVSYSWKPQRCKVCLFLGYANGAYQQPSQKSHRSTDLIKSLSMGSLPLFRALILQCQQ